MRWSENTTLEFVKLYLKNVCLWNPDHPGYRVKFQREKALLQLCTEFKLKTNISLTIQEAKLKVKNLRSTYTQEITKILQKSAPDYIYKPSLAWFEEMDNCLKHVHNNRLSSSGNTSTDNNEEVDSSCQIWVEQQNKGEIEEAPDPLTNLRDEGYEYLDESTPIAPKETQGQHKQSKRRRIKEEFYELELTDDPNNIENDTKEDEFDIYGKYIASQLRKMDLQKALRVQLEIQTLVSEARISSLVND